MTRTLTASGCSTVTVIPEPDCCIPGAVSEKMQLILHEFQRIFSDWFHMKSLMLYWKDAPN